MLASRSGGATKRIVMKYVKSGHSYRLLQISVLNEKLSMHLADICRSSAVAAWTFRPMPASDSACLERRIRDAMRNETLQPMSNGFDRILAVYDRSVGGDDVLVEAILLARATGAKLKVARVLGEYERSPAVLDEARRRLSRLVPWIVQEGVEQVSTEVLVGIPHAEIIREVLSQDHDLVIASTETGRSIKDVVLGSAALNLMRKCPCPVWIVKPRQIEQIETTLSVMAAVDVPAEGPAAELNAKILRCAAALAEARGAAIHLVNCWEVEGSEAEMLRSEIKDWTREKILRKHKNIHAQAVDALISCNGAPKTQLHIHLPRGTHQRNIISLAQQVNPMLIVMGTTGRMGLPGILLGNSVELILDAAPCGVLVVKPDGFRTPISVPAADMGAIAIDAVSR